MRLGFWCYLSKAPSFNTTVPNSCQKFPGDIPFTLLHRSMAPNHAWMKSVLLCLVVCSNPHNLQLLPKLGNNTSHILYDQATSCTHKYSLKNSLGTLSASFWLHCDTGTFLCSRGGFFIMRHSTRVRSSSSDQKKSVPESAACSPRLFMPLFTEWPLCSAVASWERQSKFCTVQ